MTDQLQVRLLLRPSVVEPSVLELHAADVGSQQWLLNHYDAVIDTLEFVAEEWVGRKLTKVIIRRVATDVANDLGTVTGALVSVQPQGHELQTVMAVVDL